ncbi:MAG: ExbD/TolR family protein, partial [Gemmatimonadota bacterium]
IPTAGLADIAFLLLIFFMVTTVFRRDQKQEIRWVEAEATKKIDEKRKNILHLWVDVNGEIYINDKNIAVDQVADVVRPIYADNRELVIAIRADREIPYSKINAITKQLQSAGAVRVTFATRLEQRVTRPRR